MKTEFIEYLKNLPHYANQHNPLLLEASKNTMQAAADGKLKKIISVFLDFPLTYDIDVNSERKTLAVVAMTKINCWLQRYEELLVQGRFTQTLVEDTVVINAFPSTVAKIKEFNADILITACADLLDAEGNLKRDIVDFYGMDHIIDAYEDNLADKEKILHSIVYSYWMEIVMVNLSLLAVRKDCDIQQLEWLNGFSRQLLFGNGKFSGFFVGVLDEYKEKFSEMGLSIYLRDLPADKITGKVVIDTQRVVDPNEG